MEQIELRDLDFDLLEQQQFSSPDPPVQRLDWADQQDAPEGETANTDLLDPNEGEGVEGAPVTEVVIQRPPNFNIFHGESPPRLTATDLPAGHTPRVKQEVTTEQVGAAFGAPESSTVKQEEAQPSDPVLPFDSIGEVDYGDDEEELGEQEEASAPAEGAASSAPAEAAAEVEEQGEPRQPVRRRGIRGGPGRKEEGVVQTTLSSTRPSTSSMVVAGLYSNLL